MTDNTGDLTGEMREQLKHIACEARERQSDYMPVWGWKTTDGTLAPGHVLDMAAIQRHFADLVVLTDWMPSVLAALEESEKRREKVEEALRRIANYLAENERAYSGGNMAFVNTGAIERWAREALEPGEGG